MERNALWSADDGGFAVLIFVHRLRVETGNLPLAEIRMEAAARAVELALEYRIELANVREAGEAV
jgi:hypothetical protein